MNAEHRERLASDEWRRSLVEYVLPFTLGPHALADLGDNILEVGPGPGLTTDLLRESLPRITAISGDIYNPIDPDLLTSRLIRIGFTDVDVESNRWIWACRARRSR